MQFILGKIKCVGKPHIYYTGQMANKSKYGCTMDIKKQL